MLSYNRAYYVETATADIVKKNLYKIYWWEDYGVMAPRLVRERRHILSFVAESPDSADATGNCEIWVDENGKLRIAVV